MQTDAAATRGRFVWHDLMTPDVEAARAFYSAACGWGTEEWDSPVPYLMWTGGGRARGGYMAIPGTLAAQGVRPHWLTYIGVPDVDVSVSEAVALGARVMAAPEDIPAVGRFAVAQDPQGAPFALFSTSSPAPDEGEEAPVGAMSWHELWTSDSAAAYDFYGRLLGWEGAGEFADPQIGVYRMFGRNGVPLGGMASMTPEMGGVPPHWLPYVRVADIDAAVAAVRAGGGTVMHGPMEVPGGGRVAQCMDPQGAAFALHQTAA